MSIQAMAWVLEESKAEGSARLVLLAIANHADHRHWSAFPSAAQVAREARVSRATVFRCLDVLVALGELEITHGGGGRGRVNRYRVGGAPPLGSQDETFSEAERVSVRVSSAQKKGLTRATGTVINHGTAPQPQEPAASLPPAGGVKQEPAHRLVDHVPCRVCGDLTTWAEGRCEACATAGLEREWRCRIR